MHPKLRKGYEIEGVEAEKALRNYHSKIEFIDRFSENNQIEEDIPIESIVWFHQLRNELYHSGNGMIPELHVLNGSRYAALKIFQALFSVDISGLLEGGTPGEVRELTIPYVSTGNAEMEFLRVFINFEKAVRDFMTVHYKDRIEQVHSVGPLWMEYVQVDSPGKEMSNQIDQAIKIRNKIAHGQTVDISKDKLLSYQ